MEDQSRPLDGTISKISGKLDRLLGHRTILPKGVEDEILLIKHDIEEILAILSNLEDDHAIMVRCWRKEVRELSYDMEDFIDQYEHADPGSRTGSIPRRMITQRLKSRTTLYMLREKLRRRLWMANKIREFSVRVQELLQRHNMYNLGSIASSSSRRCTGVRSASWHSTSCGDDSTLVGISDAMNKLEEQLMMMPDEDHQKLKVVSIVGFGGTGKTTLANELYHKLGWQFECKAFLRTSQKPDMRKLFISMVSQVRPPQPPDNWTVHSLISTIMRHLQHKRYFIIVDGLWATTTWDLLKRALPDGSCCSRILITTEIEDLALHSCGYDPNYIFKMKPLGEDDSRKLFFSSVFGPQQECPPEHREVYCDVIRKCGGFPLAIVTIASIFAGQQNTKDQIDYLNKSLGVCLITNPTLEGMKQVIDISYNNLPQHLKACILYTGLYEEDIIIWRDDLVNQWIAEGFICATGGQDKQEISRDYFNELVCRKMIQPVRTNDNGEVLSCVIHHMVLNIITYKSMEENFITVVHHSQANGTLADKVRRLSLHFGNAEDACAPTSMRLSQVRTLVYFGVFSCMPSTARFRLLRVLILHFWGDKDSISLDLTRILELFRLRYFKVSSNVTVDLHTQMHGLQYLETLTIDARVRAVPSDIVHLTGLLHLSLPAKTILPNGIGHMTSLCTLEFFDLSTNTMENMQSLSMLTNLRELQLTCSTVQLESLNNKMKFLLNTILGRLSNLTSLNLVTQTSSDANSLNDADAISIISGGFSSASTALTLLQSLDVSPRICIFFYIPKWIGRLHKLCILKIGVTKLTTEGVDVLKGLPALAVLSLYVETKPASRIVIGKTGFPAIRYFKFNCYDPLLKFDEDAMPNLRKLKLVFNAHSADQLSIPIGINFLSGLKEVSAKIGGAGLDRSHRRAAELVFRESIRVHARCQRVHVQCVENIIGGMKGKNSITILDDKNSYEHEEILLEYSGQEGNRGSDNRKPGKMLMKHILTSSPDSNDGYSWSKHGQRESLGSKHPRGYYHCKGTDHYGRRCWASKEVQQTDGEPILFDVRYYGEHTCDQLALSNHQSSETIVRAEAKQPLSTELPRANLVKPSMSTDCPTPVLSDMRSTTRREVVMMNNPGQDGYSWRKYGQKDILGAKHPRYGTINYTSELTRLAEVDTLRPTVGLGWLTLSGLRTEIPAEVTTNAITGARRAAWRSSRYNARTQTRWSSMSSTSESTPVISRPYNPLTSISLRRRHWIHQLPGELNGFPGSLPLSCLESDIDNIEVFQDHCLFHV